MSWVKFIIIFGVMYYFFPTVTLGLFSAVGKLFGTLIVALYEGIRAHIS